MIDNVIFIIPLYGKVTQHPFFQNGYPRFLRHDIANNCLHPSSPAFAMTLPSVFYYMLYTIKQRIIRSIFADIDASPPGQNEICLYRQTELCHQHVP